jgi:hypothetical protein
MLWYPQCIMATKAAKASDVTGVNVAADGAPPSPAERGGGELQAALLAEPLIPEAIAVLQAVMKAPSRNSASQVAAARLVFELTSKLPRSEPQIGSTPAGKLRLVDAERAAQVLTARLKRDSE